MGVAAASGNRVRRVRVRPEFAWLYPEIVPGVWMSAAKAARLAQQTDPMQKRAHSCACGRLLCEIHFEFRGGCSREKRTGAWQSRVEYRGPYKICFDLVPTSASELIERHTLSTALDSSKVDAATSCIVSTDRPTDPPPPRMAASSSGVASPS